MGWGWGCCWAPGKDRGAPPPPGMMVGAIPAGAAVTGVGKAGERAGTGIAPGAPIVGATVCGQERGGGGGDEQGRQATLCSNCSTKHDG